ncbi:hypothetical protein GCM10010885_05860 [Alicyclobacillus cellulosilyticus]|uniref:Uncharacterized protein n=1 Tax=Alicyclobacillus cellulosilyticus TaxID=1003997 RepID=A0A917NGS3_9BACL|nr:HesB/YadR/YfhF family protein [Alicyclobacillus cellulosilyticus]GGI99298.1 hypothetical protein GCM10010885_05860 [Alicyclobacillus cellulosilyticus]
MHIDVSPRAVSWMREELNVRPGDWVRIYVRYGGSPQFQPGFSLGLAVEPPADVGSCTEQDGIRFYIRHSDLWYFDGHDLTIEYNDKEEGPEFVVGTRAAH